MPDPNIAVERGLRMSAPTSWTCGMGPVNWHLSRLFDENSGVRGSYSVCAIVPARLILTEGDATVDLDFRLITLIICTSKRSPAQFPAFVSAIVPSLTVCFRKLTAVEFFRVFLVGLSSSSPEDCTVVGAATLTYNVHQFRVSIWQLGNLEAPFI